jgi:uncharacterized protein involved in outer membrane biogenesis
MTGKLWFNHLHVEDLRGEVKETGAGDEFDWKDWSLPFLVVEEVQLRNLSLAYLERDQQRHSVELSYVSLDDTDNRGPVKVSAAGEINARTLHLEGTLGSLQQLRSDNQTYPIDIILSTGDGDTGADRQIIDISGTVGHTQSGRRQVDAVFDADIPELLPIFDKEVVADKLGHIQGSFIAVEDGYRWRIRETRFAATGTDAYQLRVSGSIENTGQFSLDSEFSVPDPAAFGSRFGIELSGYAPFKSKGLISGNQNRLDYRGETSIGRTGSKTELTVLLGEHKPRIKSLLNIDQLYLADIGLDHRLSIPAASRAKANPAAGGQAEPETNAPTPDESQLVLDREPLDFSGLQQFDLDLVIQVNEVIGADFSIEKLAGEARLADGALRVSPMQLTFAGAETDLEFALDTRETPTVNLMLTTGEFLLAGVVPQQQREKQVTGKARLNIDINSKGRSVHELVSALSGGADLSLEEASFPVEYMEYLATDVPKPLSAGDVDTRVIIDGKVALEFDKQVVISTEAVRVVSDDGSYDISLGKLDMQPDLISYLETGTLWFHNLTIADLHAEIVETDLERKHDSQEPDWHEFDLQVSHLPFVLIEKMQLSNLSLTYRREDEQDTVKVSSFLVDNENSREPMQVSALGTVNDIALKLEGSVGTTAQPRGKNQVYPIDFDLSSGNADAVSDRPVIRINGSVDRSTPGRSLLQASFDVAVAELLSMFKQQGIVGRLGHLQGSVSVADADNRWSIRSIDIASTDTDLYRLSIEGAVDDSNRLELHSETEVPDPAALGAQFGVDLSGYGAYRGKGVLSTHTNRIRFRGQANIGRIENDTILDVTLVEGKPFIQGRFIIPNLYLPDIGLDKYLGVNPDTQVTANPHAGEPHESAELALPATDSQIIFDREALDFNWLHDFNLDLEILIDHITGVDFSIEKLEGNVGLNDGLLLLSPMRLTFEGGITDFELELDARNTPSVSLKLTGDDLLLEETIARVQEEVPVKGKVHLKVEIVSSGFSEHELASNLSGKLSFSLEKARVPKKYVEFLTADLFSFLFRSVTFEDSYATLHCVLTGIEIDQGVAKTVLLFGDGPRLAVDGSATVDLGQETIDMVLLPKAKKRLKLDYSQITVKGPLANPEVKATGTVAAAATTVGGFILLPEVVVPVFLAEQVWKFFSSDDKTGCSDYIEDHKVEVEQYRAR